MSEEQGALGVIRDIVHINLNVADLDRSLAFYQRLGFGVLHVFGDPDRDPAEGMSFGKTRCRGAVLSLGDHPRSFTKIELIQWIEPAVEPVAPRSLYAQGVSRIALRTKNLRAFVAGLARDGIEPEGPIQEVDLVGASRFVVFRDPDGIAIELVEF